MAVGDGLTAKALGMATFGILVALVLAFLIETVLIWLGVNQILSIGVGVVSLLVEFLGCWDSVGRELCQLLTLR